MRFSWTASATAPRAWPNATKMAATWLVELGRPRRIPCLRRICPDQHQVLHEVRVPSALIPSGACDPLTIAQMARTLGITEDWGNMTAYLLYAGAALYLACSSISPCPSATNLAAISYVGRKVGNSRAVMAPVCSIPWGMCPLSGPGGPAGHHGHVYPRRVAVPSEVYAPGAGADLPPARHVPGRPITTELGGASMSDGMQKRVDAMGISVRCRWACCLPSRSARLPPPGSLGFWH